MNDEVLIKLVIIGECGVGKSNLLSRYVKNEYSEITMSTIATEFYTIKTEYEDRPARIQIWDTAGQERYRTLVPSFLNKCDGVVLVFDLTQKETFDKLTDWIELVHDKVSEDTKMLIIGNKSDLGGQREVHEDQARKFAEKLNLFYWETSAKTNANGNVEKAFEELAQCCLSDKIEAEKNEENNQGRFSSFNKRGSLRDIKFNIQEKSKSCC